MMGIDWDLAFVVIGLVGSVSLLLGVCVGICEWIFER